MDFKDWRKASDNTTNEPATSKIGRYRGKQYFDYIDEQIREAQERGEFDNLPGTGKPLNLDQNPYSGDKAMAYSLLKQNGYVPPEVELAKEIRIRFEKAQQKLEKLCQQRKSLTSRRAIPFEREKRAFNDAVERASVQYEQLLHELNRKILNLNLMTPSSMHMPIYNVDKLVQEFSQSCPPIE